MRKSLFFVLALTAMAIVAQNKMNFHTFWGIESLDVNEIDTIKFEDGVINIKGNQEKVFNLAEVDSATFTLTDGVAERGDTVFVTYKDNEVVIDNPYSAIRSDVSGTNVSFYSSAGVKGVVFYLSGSSSDGSFTLTPDRAYTIVLDNFNLASSACPFVLNLGADGESYAATVNLRGKSVLSDGALSTYKGVVSSKSKLKFYDEADGTLEFKASVKHALHVSKDVEMYGGNLVIASGPGDGVNCDAFEMYGGVFSVFNVSGDAVDCSESVFIENGVVEIVSSADDVKGLKADSAVVINGGQVSVSMSGAASKGVKTKFLPIYVNGGEVTVSVSGASLITSVDTSYVAAFKSDTDIVVTGGDLQFNCSGENGKALSADGNVEIKGGSVFAEMSGPASRAIKANGSVSLFAGEVEVSLTSKVAYVAAGNDYGYNSAVRADGDISLNGATVNIYGEGLAAKGFSADGSVFVSGGSLSVSLTGSHNYELANADTVSVSAVKADKDVVITGGSLDVVVGSAAYASKAIKTKSDFVVSGGLVKIENNGGYFATLSSSSSTGGFGGRPGMGGNSTTTVNSSGSHAVKAVGNVSISGGVIELVSKNGKGISCDKDIVLGVKGGSSTDFSLNIVAGCDDGKTYTTSGRTKFESKPKGIKADGVVNINSGDINIKAYDTGILSPELNVNGGVIEVWAKYDQGLYGKSFLNINGGDTYISASYEGLSGLNMNFNGGLTYVVSSDDGWNASAGKNGSGTPVLNVTGGSHFVNASGGGLDSNGSMTISGGVTVCCQSGGGNSALDTDGGITHTGGYVLGIGSNGMFSECIPRSSVSHIYSTSIAATANSYFIVADSNGNVLSALKMPIGANAAVCAYSEDISGYKFYVGNTFNGNLDLFNGQFGLYGIGTQNISTSDYVSYTVSTGSSSNNRPW